MMGVPCKHFDPLLSLTVSSKRVENERACTWSRTGALREELWGFQSELTRIFCGKPLVFGPFNAEPLAFTKFGLDGRPSDLDRAPDCESRENLTRDAGSDNRKNEIPLVVVPGSSYHTIDMLIKLNGRSI